MKTLVSNKNIWNRIFHLLNNLSTSLVSSEKHYIIENITRDISPKNTDTRSAANTFSQNTAASVRLLQPVVEPPRRPAEL